MLDTAPQNGSSNKINGRDQNGRFSKGNKFGPGNPFARKVAALRSAVINNVTENDIQMVAERLLAEAKGGDVAAIKVLFAYAIGKPAASVDPDSLDLMEMRGFQQAAIAPQSMMEMVQSMPLGLAVEMWRIVQPCLASKTGKFLSDGLAVIEAAEKGGASPSPNGDIGGYGLRLAILRAAFAKLNEKAPSTNGDNGTGDEKPAGWPDLDTAAVEPTAATYRR